MSLPNFLLSRVPLLSDPMDAIERALRFRASSSLNGTTSWGLLDLAGFSCLGLHNAAELGFP